MTGACARPSKRCISATMLEVLALALQSWAAHHPRHPHAHLKGVQHLHRMPAPLQALSHCNLRNQQQPRYSFGGSPRAPHPTCNARIAVKRV
jgi:hypothetical protein